MKGKPGKVRKARRLQLQKAVVNTKEHQRIRDAYNAAHGGRPLTPWEIARDEEIRNMKMPSHPPKMTPEERLNKYWR